MISFIDALRRFLLASGRTLAAAWEFMLRFLSVPVNLCLTVLCLCFASSLSAWAFGEPFERAVLFFPVPGARAELRGELHNVPHSRSAEARAELIASELLLGPQSTTLAPAFAPGSRVESAILRKGRLFVDISADAALAPDPSTLKKGIAAMDRSLRFALPGIKRISLTIGGLEPYAAGLSAEGGKE